MKFGVFHWAVFALFSGSVVLAGAVPAKPVFTRFVEEVATRSGQDVIAVREAAVQSLVLSKKYTDADIVRIRDGKESEIAGMRQSNMVHTIQMHGVFQRLVATWAKANTEAFKKASLAFEGIEMGALVDKLKSVEGDPLERLGAAFELERKPYNKRYEEIYKISDVLSFQLTSGKASTNMMVAVLHALGTRWKASALVPRIQLEICRIALHRPEAGSQWEWVQLEANKILIPDTGIPMVSNEPLVNRVIDFAVRAAFDMTPALVKEETRLAEDVENALANWF